jgi:hypothetical protein
MKETHSSEGVIILGMHRSGTSLLASLVHAWGAFAGEQNQLLKANPWNRAGYWEYKPLVYFNHEMLCDLRCEPLLPPSDADEEKIRALAETPQHRGRALGLCQEMTKSGNVWVWKDPRMVLLLSFWREILHGVRFVITIRDPVAIALSMARRDGLPLTAGLLLWQRYMQCILRFLNCRSEPRIFIVYEELLADPAAGCERLADFLAGLDSAAANPFSKVSAMMSAVRSELNHNSARSDMPLYPAMTPDQRWLQDRLREYAKGNTAEMISEEKFYMYPGWRDYLSCWMALRNAGKACTEELSRFKLPRLD